MACVQRAQCPRTGDTSIRLKPRSRIPSNIRDRRRPFVRREIRIGVSLVQRQRPRRPPNSRAEDFLKDAFSGIEDAIVQFATTGKLEIRELANSIVADLIRIQIQKQITGPLANWLGGLLGGGSASWFSGLFHDGGPVTAGAGAARTPVAALEFEGAPRLHVAAWRSVPTGHTQRTSMHE